MFNKNPIQDVWARTNNQEKMSPAELYTFHLSEMGYLTQFCNLTFKKKILLI